MKIIIKQEDRHRIWITLANIAKAGNVRSVIFPSNFPRDLAWALSESYDLSYHFFGVSAEEMIVRFKS